MYTFILVRFEIRVDREPKIYYFHLHPFKHRFKYPPKSSSERGYSRFKTSPPLPSLETTRIQVDANCYIRTRITRLRCSISFFR